MWLLLTKLAWFRTGKRCFVSLLRFSHAANVRVAKVEKDLNNLSTQQRWLNNNYGLNKYFFWCKSLIIISFRSKILRVFIHIYLPLTLWLEFLSQCEDISLIIWFSSPDCESHLKGRSKNLQYVRVRIFSQILDICMVHSIQFFIFISKI